MIRSELIRALNGAGAALVAVALAGWTGAGADPRSASAPPRPSRAEARAFVPPHAQVVALRRVAATGAIPAQLVVTWQADDPDGGDAVGVSVWEHSGRNRWRRLYRARGPVNVPPPAVEIADVTRDGHLDVLIVTSNGSAHGCGPRRLLALERGRARSIWATEDDCDPAPRLSGHVLVVDTPAGIEKAICCPAFMRHRVLRWDGSRMRVVLQQWFPSCLFGTAYCGTSASRRPVRLALHDVAWWDGRRGVATARDLNRAHLELVATTADAGRHWQLVLATFLHLRPPRLGPGGHVRVDGLRCHGACRPQRRFAATGFGAAWTDTAVPR